MTRLSDFKNAMREGAYIEITDHRITHPKHSRFGPRRHQIEEANGSAFYVHGERIPWPASARLQDTTGPDDAVGGRLWTILGEPGQEPTAARLTIRVLRPAPSRMPPAEPPNILTPH